MTEEDQKYYKFIVLKKWKEIKKDPERLIECNSKVKQI